MVVVENEKWVLVDVRSVCIIIFRTKQTWWRRSREAVERDEKESRSVKTNKTGAQ